MKKVVMFLMVIGVIHSFCAGSKKMESKSSFATVSLISVEETSE